MQATDLRKDVYDVLDEVASSREPVEIFKHKRSVAVLLPSANLPPGKRKPTLDLDAVAAFCRSHDVKSFALFGSILRDDWDEESDVDVLVDVGGRSVEFHEECRMLDELESMFGRRVDLVPTSALESMHPARRSSISEASKVIYETS